MWLDIIIIKDENNVLLIRKTYLKDGFLEYLAINKITPKFDVFWVMQCTRIHLEDNLTTCLTFLFHQVVRQMPTIASNKQPTIAIITAHYAEKLAVDTMIENQETFVRYTTVGKKLAS